MNADRPIYELINRCVMSNSSGRDMCGSMWKIGYGQIQHYVVRFVFNNTSRHVLTIILSSLVEHFIFLVCHTRDRFT